MKFMVDTNVLLITLNIDDFSCYHEITPIAPGDVLGIGNKKG